MRKFNVSYRGKSRTLLASDHTVARRLGAKWVMNQMEMIEDGFSSLKVIVVDVDASGYGAHTGRCQGCSPNEMCSRSGTCGWCDERYVIPGETIWNSIQQTQLDKVHEIWSRRAGDVKGAK